MSKEKLYNTPYHNIDLSESTYLITGGAGFIGSNLVEYLLRYGAKRVRVLDNLSNGYYANIKEFESHENFEFIKGDIRDIEVCKRSLEGIDYVSHQAALGSVPRSISDPITTHEVNISGFLNLLDSVRKSPTVKRMVYAASSSTYGDNEDLPKIEGREGKPLSPYAVTKAVNEMYADVYSKVYGLHTIGLRYFNVFGPKQNPDNPYAAVIPIFCKAFIGHQRPSINGDGETSRDFTFVENVIQANIKSLCYVGLSKHEVYNIACGDNTSLNDIIEILGNISGRHIKPIYGPARDGDIKHSMANIFKSKVQLGYLPSVNFRDGLNKVYNYYHSEL